MQEKWGRKPWLVHSFVVHSLNIEDALNTDFAAVSQNHSCLEVINSPDNARDGTVVATLLTVIGHKAGEGHHRALAQSVAHPS